MAGVRDWLPGTRAAQLEMAKKWMMPLNANKNRWKVPDAELTKLNLSIVNVDDAQEIFELNATPGNRARVMVAAMRWFKTRILLTPPLEYGDYADLGLRPPDTIRTPHVNVTEKVAATIGPGNVREVVIRFWIEGASHRAKPAGYDGAVIIWAVGPAPFTRIEDLNGGHTMASRTPHTLLFTDDQRGQTVSVALAWQNERGITGEWSEILSTVIP